MKVIAALLLVAVLVLAAGCSTSGSAEGKVGGSVSASDRAYPWGGDSKPAK